MFFPVQIWMLTLISNLLWNPYNFSGHEKHHQDRQPKKELSV